MKKLAFFCFLLFSCSCIAKDIGYDPLADPFQQIDESAIQAKKENKYILVISGGDWCRWCHVLDDYLSSNKKIYNDLKNSFVLMKVYLGDKNYNDEFFSQLPESKGAPHFWVLNANKEVLLSQNTSVFEKGRNSYDDEVFTKFINLIEEHKSKSGSR
ncbi:thioredoxin family protein [Microbulbifer sp. EKSA008]|uniref:thioredoxin family protein n=1 Tax=unclassified Microbulbifer TaxID=2619833 RepID=UPI0039B569F0